MDENLNINLESYDKAQSYYESILDTDYSNGEVFYRLGFIAHKNKEYELAKNYLLNALDCGYMNSDVYLQLSATHIALEDFINLIPYLHNGLYIEPNNSNLLYNLGVSYYETGLYNKSIK